MKTVSLVCVALALLVALPGCRSSADRAADKAAKQKAKDDERSAQEAEMKKAIPAGSPLAKLEVGMSEGEVASILGAPTSQDSHITGKQFNPFNYGGRDTRRLVYYYKGIGRVEFSNGRWGQRNGIVLMEADTSEPGYARN